MPTNYVRVCSMIKGSKDRSWYCELVIQYKWFSYWLNADGWMGTHYWKWHILMTHLMNFFLVSGSIQILLPISTDEAPASWARLVSNHSLVTGGNPATCIPYRSKLVFSSYQRSWHEVMVPCAWDYSGGNRFSCAPYILLSRQTQCPMCCNRNLPMTLQNQSWQDIWFWFDDVAVICSMSTHIMLPYPIPYIIRREFEGDGVNLVIGSEFIRMSFQTDIKDADAFAREVTQVPGTLQVCECYQSWAGPCKAIQGTFKRIYFDAGDKPLKFFTVGSGTFLICMCHWTFGMPKLIVFHAHSYLAWLPTLYLI